MYLLVDPVPALIPLFGVTNPSCPNCKAGKDALVCQGKSTYCGQCGLLLHSWEERAVPPLLNLRRSDGKG